MLTNLRGAVPERSSSVDDGRYICGSPPAFIFPHKQRPAWPPGPTPSSRTLGSACPLTSARPLSRIVLMTRPTLTPTSHQNAVVAMSSKMASRNLLWTPRFRRRRPPEPRITSTSPRLLSTARRANMVCYQGRARRHLRMATGMQVSPFRCAISRPNSQPSPTQVLSRSPHPLWQLLTFRKWR